MAVLGPTSAAPRSTTGTAAHRAARALVVCLSLLLTTLALPTSPAGAATLPSGFSQTTLASGIGLVTTMAFAPDGRLFVTTQDGSVRILKDGRLLSTPFLKLTVDSRGERGLTGIAIDPDFATNQYVYLYYTVPGTPAHNRVSRFVAEGDVARATAGAPAETVLLDLEPLGADRLIHNSGAMAFGADGKLYITVGDNAIGSNAQTLNNRLGKVLRVNADGSIPADNPFIGKGATGVNQAIWALGLRNPFTFAFSRSGRMFVNDVGQSTWEEINDISAGANYGWPTTEGPTTDPRFRSPIYAYGHSGEGVTGCAITGGAFYDPPSPRYPSDYAGDYFFADFCNHWIKRRDASTGVVTDFMASSSPHPVDLKVGPDGNLYYLSRGSQSVVRVDFAGASPVAITDQPDSRTVSAGEPVSFTVDASGSAPLTYQWRRDGVPVPGATGATYTLPQTTAADDGARFDCVVGNGSSSVTSATATLTVTADRRPTADITSPLVAATYSGGDVISYDGSGTDPEDGALPASAYTWRVDFHHADHTHPFVEPTSGARGGTFTVPTSGHVDSNVWYRVHLEVRDSAGLVGAAYRDVHPRKAGLTVASVPTGLQVEVDDQPRRTPYAEQAVVGLRRQLSAPATQSLGGVDYVFESWSDGGSASHEVTTTAQDTTYTATYRAAATRTLVLSPVADTVARQQAPSSGSGSSTSLLSDTQETTGSATRATPYLRFTVPALAAGESVRAAQLSLQVSNGTTNGPALWRTSTSWSESALTWNSGQPARSGTAAVGNFASMGSGRVSTAVSGITGAGAVSLQLYAEASDGMQFASRESTTTASRPQLVLTIATSG